MDYFNKSARKMDFFVQKCLIFLLFVAKRPMRGMRNGDTELRKYGIREYGTRESQLLSKKKPLRGGRGNI